MAVSSHPLSLTGTIQSGPIWLKHLPSLYRALNRIAGK